MYVSHPNLKPGYEPGVGVYNPLYADVASGALTQ